MADTKISALTTASTPLDGTEVLPVVQSGTTKKVANNDLRPKQIQSNATSGVLQVVGPAAASTRVMTTPDANFTSARTDAAQSFTGDQTLGTGNLVQGTAAKGINFTANAHASGMTSQLLNWYEEGTWTPTIASTTGGITSYTSTGNYVRVGKMVTLTGKIVITNNGTGAGAIFVESFPYADNSNSTPALIGREGVTGKAVTGSVVVGQSRAYTNFYDGTYWGATNNELYFTISYITS